METKQFRKAENTSERKVEWLIFGVYAIALIVISCYHEPWYDEAEAWQIARGASLSDLFFYIPHYEGHPPLWHLLLAIPARVGVPYEWGLKTVACLAALGYGWLLLFRSPFPKVLRYSLPFQYFFFYQYGVISRPYGLMVLCLLLMAMTFSERNERPGRFVLSMAVLCALSGYGIVLAGGICIAWVWDICREKKWKFFTADFWKDRRIFWLAGLLVGALLIILQILPREDTYATVKTGPFAESMAPTNSLAFRLFYTLFLMLPDSTVTTMLGDYVYLDRTSIGLSSALMGAFVGICLLTAIVFISNRKNCHYFFTPYILFGVFSALVYFTSHHMGILFAFTVFWLWIALEDEGSFEIWKKVEAKVVHQEQDRKTLRRAGKIALVILILPSLYWSLAASVSEVNTIYYHSRDIAKFLKDTGLYELKVMADYDMVSSGDYDILDCINTEHIPRPVAILPYFDRNFCLNLHMGRDDAGYTIHRIPNRQENQEAIEAWKSMGPPDVLIGAMNLSPVFGDEVTINDYARVYEYAFPPNIWKAHTSVSNTFYKDYIFLRRDLLEEYGLEEISLTVPFP